MGSRKDSEWYKFQEEIRDHFEALGASATTNVSIKGVRGSHDIDILVKPKFFGHEILWLVEAKNWSSSITKEKVLAFLSIIQDVGADRGFLISNGGFQRGAIKCAESTNISLVNFEKFKKYTKDFVNLEVLKHYEQRYKILHARYWAHPKRIRKDYDLRHDHDYESPFSGIGLLNFIEKVIKSIRQRKYPINTDTRLKINAGEKTVHDFQEACNWLNLNLNLLDRQLLKAEMQMMRYGDFKPEFDRWKNAFED